MLMCFLSKRYIARRIRDCLSGFSGNAFVGCGGRDEPAMPYQMRYWLLMLRFSSMRRMVSAIMSAMDICFTLSQAWE